MCIRDRICRNSRHIVVVCHKADVAVVLCLFVVRKIFVCKCFDITLAAVSYTHLKSIIQLEMMPQPPEQRAASNPWPEWPKTLKTDYGQEEAIAVFGEDPRQYETTVKQLLSQDGKLIGVKTVKVRFQDGKLQEVPDSEQVLDADLLLIAAGFVGCEPYVPEAFGVELTARNTVNSEEGNYKTNVDKVFSAGDMRRGQSLVVWAIAEGNQCAKQVDEYLMGYTNME